MTTDKTIIALDDYEHVLKRPEMYVGSVAKSEERVAVVKDATVVWEVKDLSVGFYKCVNEILDNAFDEAKRLGGKMKKIEVHFNSKNNQVRVTDSGGGFLNASGINPKTGISNVETAMTALRAGSNFNNENVRENLIGTNGVGASVVNMLSDYFFIRTVNEDEVFEQEWKRFVSPGSKIKPRTTEPLGTEIRFTPRKDKFKKTNWDKGYVHTLMLYREFLKKDDPEISKVKFICFFDKERLDLRTKFIPETHIKVKNRFGTFILWESYPNSANLAFVNGALCTGVHQRIFGEHINNVFDNPLAGRFYEMLIVLNLPPKFVSFGDQNKTRYATGRGEITPLIQKNFFSAIKKSLRSSPLFDSIQQRIAAAEREGDVRNIRKKKAVRKATISEKYFPPSKKTGNLFIVEGSSASGSVLQRRDPKEDAVYALRGKVKNARRLGDLTSNNEIIDLMNILNLDPENDMNCKFDRIIIAADADPDGLGHIASLIVNLFYKWFPNVVREGKLFILRTPLMTTQQGKNTKYFYTTKEYENFIAKNKPGNLRYLKGLGSLSIADWEYVFSDMQLLKIIEDPYAKRMIDVAFGSNAAMRKKWLRS